MSSGSTSKGRAPRTDGTAWGSQEPPTINKGLATLIDNLILILGTTPPSSQQEGWLILVNGAKTKLTEKERDVQAKYTSRTNDIMMMKNQLRNAKSQAERDSLQEKISHEHTVQSDFRNQLVRKGNDLYCKDLWNIEKYFENLGFENLQNNLYTQDDIKAAIVLMGMK